MAKFRKKPVVIEAVQLRWDTWNDVCEFAGVGKLADGKPEGCYTDKHGRHLPFGGGPFDCIGLLIPTLEGVMTATQNDWIIKGVKGELYACKPDIFELTYEPVEPDAFELGAELRRFEKAAKGVY